MAIEQGIRRPPQVTEKKNVIEQKHERLRLYDDNGAILAEPHKEVIPVFSITIESLDSRLTDVLSRACSAVLHAWQHEIGNATQNVLMEQKKWENDVPPAPVPSTEDITKPPVAAPAPTGGQGNG